MENTTTNPEPGFSQYYVNNPPDFFDELVENKIDPATTQGHSSVKAANRTPMPLQSQPANPLFPAVPSTQSSNIASSAGNLISNTFTGGFKPLEYLENPAELEEDLKIPDVIRNHWRSPVAQGQLMLTSPGIQTAADLPDLIAVAVSKHLGDAEVAQRKILDVDNVTQDERGLRSLIAAGCNRAAINLTGRLLTIYGQGYGRAGQPAKHSPHSLQLWFTRLALLAKLREYGLLQQEAEPFDNLNRPDVFYKFYPEMYPGKTGSIACFSFRLLLAEVPAYLGNPQLALERSLELFGICHDIKLFYGRKKAKEAQIFWKKRELRALHAIVNCAIILKKYDVSDNILRRMISEGTDLERRALYSAWGRIYLQIGNIVGAEQKFTEARRLRKIYTQPDIRDLVDKGLITVAKNDFPEAYANFQKALCLGPPNTMIVNNMSICLLYAGKLKEARELLERAIDLIPQKFLNESLLINLSTLYELESNNPKDKKLNLLRLINRYKPDLNISLECCLKLQTPN